jgi:hypothetical protein
LPWSTCAIMAMLRSFEFIVCRFVMSMRPDEQGCKRYLATPIDCERFQEQRTLDYFSTEQQIPPRFPGLDPCATLKSAIFGVDTIGGSAVILLPPGGNNIS